jgi:CRISPR/Cas system-associated exonuclease Cas4 (RecB family)
MMKKRRYRRASEVGEFVYCHRAWWLHRIEGNRPANQVALARGESAHASHSGLVRLAALLRRGAILGVVAGIVMVLVGLALWL